MAQLPALANGNSALRRPGFWAFIVLMLGLTAFFAMLGFWQLERLAEKEAQIALVAARAERPPMPFPPVEKWSQLAPAELDFQPVTMTGAFRHDQAVLVFTSLSEAKGEYAGTGYWVMTPFDPAGGGAVFVNRGFVPQDEAERFLDDASGPTGQITITGIARRPEISGSFTPEPSGERRIDWVRDPQRLARLAGMRDVALSEFYVDQAAGPAGQLPQGGETVLAFSNRHLEYALTWFAFALMTPALLAFWIYRQHRPSQQTNLP